MKIVGKFQKIILILCLSSISFFFSSIQISAQNKSENSLFQQSIINYIQTPNVKSLCKKKEKFSLGFWKIDNAKSPLSANSNKRVYDEFFNIILKSKPTCIDLIDDVAINQISDHLKKSGAIDENGSNVLAALVDSHEDVDLVGFIELTNQSNQIFLSSRIVEKLTGKTTAALKPVSLPKTLSADTQKGNGLSLESALNAAATALLEGGNSISQIQSKGIFYENSGSQPQAAQFISEKIKAKLIEKGSNIITGKTVSVRGINITTLAETEALPSELDSGALARKDGYYELIGRYWERDDAIDLKLTLDGPNGGVATWNGLIRGSDLKGLEFKPANKATSSEPLPAQAYTFKITTEKGDAPLLRPNDEIRIKLNANKDVWVYCFYVDSKTQIENLFPLPKKFDRNYSNKINARQLMTFPMPEMKISLKIDATTVGEEMITCFATRKDVRSLLPENLFTSDGGSIQFLTIEKLRAIFQDLPDAEPTEATITVTVIK